MQEFWIVPSLVGAAATKRAIEAAAMRASLENIVINEWLSED